MVILAVDPVIDPGLMFQLPDGKPLNTTLPVATAHVGCVMMPTNGAAGVTGCAFMTISADSTEIHPDELVTV